MEHVCEKENYTLYVHISPSNKYYVGVTSKRPEERWANGCGYKYNNHFSKAIKKYGWNNFRHEILAENLTREDAATFEKMTIAALMSNDSKFGYNNSLGGDSTSLFRHSEKTKELISKRTKEEAREYTENPVYQFTLDGELIGKYRTPCCAASFVGARDHGVTIARACKHNSGIDTTSGYIWAFVSDCKDYDNFVKTTLEPLVNKIKSKQNKTYKYKPNNICHILKIDQDNNLVKEYHTLTEAYKAEHVRHQYITDAANSGKLFKGYYWKKVFYTMCGGEYHEVHR